MDSGGADTSVDDATGSTCPTALSPDCAWSYRMRLTFDNSGQDQDLADFPVLVQLDDSVIDYALTRDAGEDLRFLDADLSTVLPHEVEVWDESGTSTVWVGVPRIDANSATDHIWMYYGNDGAPDAQSGPAVWNPDYQLVWHLNEGVADSTRNGNAGTNVGTTDAPGQIGGARELDGLSQYVDSSFTTQLDTMTVEAWARGDGEPRTNANVGIVGRNTNFQLNWDHFGEFRGAFGIHDPIDWHAASYMPVVASVWYYLVGTYDGETVRAYRDGIEAGSNATPSGDPQRDTFPVRAGVNPDPSTGWLFDGRIDEVRVSSGVRSPAWIRAQHLSMTNAFISYATPEPVSG